ncbi:MAG: sulfotransferase [Chloroflexota bacterium]
MFLILGSPRSGTTLLARILDAHPHVVIPVETDFIVPVAFICHRVRDEQVGRSLATSLIVSSTMFKNSLKWFIREPEVEAVVAGAEYSTYGIVSAIYEKIRYNDWARFVGDKSPNDLTDLPILFQTGFFDRDVKVIHLVRDVRDVVLSLLPLGWAEHDAEGTFARSWSNANLYAFDRLHTRPDQYLLLRYEQLACDPTMTMESVCAFLGVDFRAEMLEPSRRRFWWDREPHQHLAGEAITTDRVGLWRAGMDAVLRARCERQAAEALAHFGYPLGLERG